MPRRSVLDRILGRDVLGHRPEEDEERAVEVTEAENQAQVRRGEMLAEHRRTLRAVASVLSDSQRRVAVAIDETGHAIEQQHRP